VAAIYLASRSPRRRELLTQIGVRFEMLFFREGPRQDAETAEDAYPGEHPDDYVRRVTRQKVDAGWQRVLARKGLRRMPVLAADTTVAIGNEMLAKPADATDAGRMLRLLSGGRHRVLTAVAVAFDGRVGLRVSESLVAFRRLEEAHIEAYVASGEPFDKAGAYGIQGRAGAFVERLEGSYSGVMGLPLFETAALLREFGVTVP
jgi:septum formation protein